MLGAICGDILGSPYEFEEIKYERPEEILLMTDKERMTDDTAMTLAVADWLLNELEGAYYDDVLLKQRLAEKFVEYACYRYEDRHLGFGGRFWSWCCKGDLMYQFDPINSYGNGAGMRVGPVGWFFDTMEETMRFAKLSADVTHDHPEGEKGAMCIAAAIFLARTGKSKQEIKEYLLRAFGYEDLQKSVAELRRDCEWSDVCMDTVPQAVVAFLESTDYASAIRNAISYGSDSDTIADMAGAIAEAFYGGVPEPFASFCKDRLPSDARELCEQFYEKRLRNYALV